MLLIDSDAVELKIFGVFYHLERIYIEYGPIGATNILNYKCSVSPIAPFSRLFNVINPLSLYSRHIEEL